MTSACNKPDPPVVQPNAQPLSFEVAGCKRVWRDRHCELEEPGWLTIWVEGNTPPQVRARGALLPAEAPRLVASGHRARYRVPSDAAEVLIDKDGAEGKVNLRPSSTAVVLDQAKTLRSAGKWPEAEALLQNQMDGLPPIERMRARAMLARLALARGDTTHAVPMLKQTAAAARDDGLLSEAAFDTLALAFVLTNNLHDFAEARVVLDQATTDFSELPTAQALLPYYKAVLEIQTGEQQSALLHLKQAIVRAERLDLHSDELAAKKQLAVILHSLGRHDEATLLQGQLVADSIDTSPCLRLGNLISLTWFLLNGETPSPEPLGNVLQRVESALASCPDPAKRRNHQLNLVYDALRHRRWGAARQLLEQLASLAGGKDNRLITWEELFRGQLSAAERHWPDALSHFARSEALALASGERALVHAARLARSHVLEAQGDLAGALQSLEEVEAIADELVRGVPLGEGQQMFALQLEGGTQSSIEVLLRRGQPARAARAARRGRLRLLGATWRASRIQALRGPRRAEWEQAMSDYRTKKAELDQIAARDWELSKAELDAAIREREVLLQQLRNAIGRAQAILDSRETGPVVTNGAFARPTLVIGRDSKQWHAFVGVGNDWQVFGLGTVDEHATTGEWGRALAPAFDHIPGLGVACGAPCSLGIIVHPLIETLDVHALDYRDAPVLSRVPVTYLLDDWSNSTERAPLQRLTSTLIVGDPNGDLPVARDEARAVANLGLTARQTTLLGGDATRGALLGVWANVDLFHFSGHARFGGLDGFESSLRLANDEQLSLADALTAAGSPRFAVLSACDAGRARSDSEGGLGMSHALIAAGSQAVLAPSRVVPDTFAARFTASLYGAMHGYSVDDWASGVKTASLRLREESPDSDWSTYRVHAAR